MAFLLIIYFIVIAGFNVTTGFLMNLPEKDSERLLLKDELLRFELDGSGGLSYNQTPVSLEDAERRITSGLSAAPNLAVLLEISPAAPWQSVVSFVELAQRLRVDSFSFSLKE
jgi:biopolymer transport protein ExbD